jgi:ferric-dicitrate binding protein FerR (iron transport regulator)
MSELELSPQEQRARERVAALSRPEADHAFRERLQADFTRGQVGTRREIVLEPPRRAAWRWALAPLLAAALIVSALALNRAPGWQVAASLGEGAITLDGRPVSAKNLAEVSRLIHPGVRVRTPEGVVLRLASAGLGMMEITPGSDVTLPSVPGRWFSRAVRAEVQGGIARFSTAPAFHGARLSIQTPEAEVEVTGTTFSVLSLPVGTCVCVLEGQVKMRERGGAMTTIGPGARHEIFNTGQAALDDHLLAHQVQPLTELRAETMRTMGAPK